MRITTLLLAATAFVGASAANAAATFTFNGGTGGLGAGETSFASFDGGAATNGGVTGTNFVIQSGTNTSGADPAVGNQGDPYLSVLGGGTANFVFTGGISQLGLDYGSADAYNTFVLHFATGPDQTVTGTQIVASADGNQTQPRTNGRLTFFAGSGPAITGLTLTSSQNSLETDNYGVIGAVPEPSTWAMMLLGFGAAGVAMRRRKSVTLQAA